MEKKLKTGHGGARPGAGRPKCDSKLYTFRAGGDVARAIDAQPDKTAFIKTSIEAVLSLPSREVLCNGAAMSLPSRDASREKGAPSPFAGSLAEPEFSRLGRAVRASDVRGVKIPSFDIRLVAGFPVPLDNDEKSQDIDMLRLLCPHPESSYLVRVQGESMIDAGIENGDIVIVDKSNREPSEKEIAVCELNGEYTLKRLAVEKDGSRWLVPANPDFPRFPITDGDAFSVWGVVTYIIHKARD